MCKKVRNLDTRKVSVINCKQETNAILCCLTLLMAKTLIILTRPSRTIFTESRACKVVHLKIQGVPRNTWSAGPDYVGHRTGPFAAGPNHSSQYWQFLAQDKITIFYTFWVIWRQIFTQFLNFWPLKLMKNNFSCVKKWSFCPLCGAKVTKNPRNCEIAR